MITRTDEIFAAVHKAKVIADVGCDHGLIAEKILKNNKAEKVIFTDISKKCLKKAEDLLNDFAEAGMAVSYCTDGLTGVNEHVDEVVIAGMGGEEIIKILSECADRLNVERLVLQPMKNSKEVREFLIKNHFAVGLDYTFYSDKKFYDLITATRLPSDITDFYTVDEYEFGRQNLKIKETGFVKKIETDIASVKSWLKSDNLSETAKVELENRLKKLESVLTDRF